MSTMYMRADIILMKTSLLMLLILLWLLLKILCLILYAGIMPTSIPILMFGDMKCGATWINRDILKCEA